MDATGPAAVYQTLLEINNALISNLTREDLFHAIATAIGRVIPFERIAVFLHDPARDVLTLSIFESSLPSTYFAVGLEMRDLSQGSPGVTRQVLVQHERPALHTGIYSLDPAYQELGRRCAEIVAGHLAAVRQRPSSQAPLAVPKAAGYAAGSGPSRAGR